MVTTPAASNSFSFELSELTLLLVLISLLYFLNVLQYLADYFIHAGLIAQIVLGMIYGPPLSGIVPLEWWNTLEAIGTLGLVLLVFHGGLSTRLDLLRKNLVLSITVALVGILLPIGLSLIIFVFAFSFTPLQGFTAGAALCSTSLGTTFAILSATSSIHGKDSLVDIRSTRIGTVLLSAAILDDIVGLIMASVVSEVSDPSSISRIRGSRLAWTIMRPVVASLGIAIISPVVTKWILLPAHQRALSKMRFFQLAQHIIITPSLLIFLVSALLAISYYAGTSILFGAYCAGCILRFIDDQEPHELNLSFEAAFHTYFEQLNTRVFTPLFFACIGASVPFVSLWRPRVLWKGLIYAVLMWIGKALTALVILAWPTPSLDAEPPVVEGTLEPEQSSIPLDAQESQTTAPNFHPSDIRPYIPSHSRSRANKPTPRAVYPALLLGFAMVSRGEIALIVAQLGRDTLGDEGYLVVMWAVVVCTLVGAFTTGQLVHWRLQKCIEGGWGTA